MTLQRLSEHDFVTKLYDFISPAGPIQSIQFLHGRVNALRKIEKALYAEGRHVFIYGERGVGKSSLAQTAAVQYQSSDNDFVLVECGHDTSFLDVMRSIGRKTVDRPSEKIETTTKTRLSAKIVSHEIVKSRTISQPGSSIDSMDYASDFIADVAAPHSEKPVVVVDEFDVMESSEERAKFSNFLKHLGDKKIGLKFIFSGIAESLEELLGGHLSAIRQLETIELDRLSWDARWEIVTDAANQFEVKVSRDLLFRIASITDGFPYYAHLVTEKLLWHLHEDSDLRTNVSLDDYYASIEAAIDGISPHLRRPYAEATDGRSSEYHHVLWSVADAYDLRRTLDNIYGSYKRIMSEINQNPLDRKTFGRRLNALKSDRFGRILTGIPNRRGWYQYSENMVRGYVRLLAESHGVPLQAEQADAPTQFGRQPRKRTRHQYHLPSGLPRGISPPKGYK